MTIFRVIDLETTGLERSEGHEIVEIASVDVIKHEAIDEVYYRMSMGRFDLVNPMRPIPGENSAIHHIIDEDVANAPVFETVAESYSKAADYLVAHNSKFEAKFLAGRGFDQPWICTYKVSMHLYPDLPSHSNQGLRYLLSDRISIPREVGMPHRALPDCLVTAPLLIYFLGLASVKQMIEWTNTPLLLKTCTFGKHEGMAWAEVPKSYLTWIVNQGSFDEDTDYTARYHLGQAR